MKIRHKLQLGRFANAPQTETAAPTAPGQGPTSDAGPALKALRVIPEGEAPTATVGGRVVEADSDFTLLYEQGDEVALLFPISDRAAVWADYHIDPDALQLEGGIAINPEYLQPILDAISDTRMSVNKGA
jgi:hypothetical protein